MEVKQDCHLDGVWNRLIFLTMKTLRVRWQTSTVEEFLRRHGKEISTGRVFLATDRPLERWTRVQFELRLADGTPFLSGTAVVMATEDPSTGRAGMLLEFDELSEEHADTIARLRDGVAASEPDPSPPIEEETRPEANPLKAWK